MPINPKIQPDLNQSLTKDKIDINLSDINDTISEEDILNINTTPKRRININKGIMEFHTTKNNDVPDSVNVNHDFDKAVSNPWNIL